MIAINPKTKKGQAEYNDAMARVRRMGEVARILKERRDCTPRHALKVAKRFVAIYGA